MKKNKMMRVASALLIAVLLTTCTISGTFAKYVTTDSASDTARVAKWGVTVAVNGNLFGKDYASTSANDNNDSIVAATSTNVHANDNVVAPGTKNEVGFKIAISGTPEVAYAISATNNEVVAEEIFLAEGSWGVMVLAPGVNDATNFTAEEYYFSNDNGVTFTKATSYSSTVAYYELIDEATVPSGGYYPIDWAVTTTGSFTAITADQGRLSLANIYTAMTKQFTKSSVNANTVSDGSYTLTWKWDFADNDSNHAADTILGNLAAGSGVIVVKATDDGYTSNLADGTDYNLENKFGIAVTVTQVD